MLEMMVPLNQQLNDMKLLYENTKACSTGVETKIEELKKGVAEIVNLKDELLSSSILNDAHSIDDDVNPFVPLILKLLCMY